MNPNRLVRIVMLCGALLGASSGAAWASCDSRPGIPANLVAQNTAPGQIALHWQSVGNVHCFDIEVSKDGKVLGQSITGGNCGKTDIVFRDLGYNQNYCFRVRSRTEGGTQGCISAQASNTACSGTSNPPLTTGQASPPATKLFMAGVEILGQHYADQITPNGNAAGCQSLCQKDQRCRAWEWDNLDRKSVCFLMSSAGPTRPNPRMTSGLKDDLVVK